MGLTYLAPFFLLSLFFGSTSLVAGSNSGFNTPLNGWYKYACTAENIKVRFRFFFNKKLSDEEMVKE